MTALPARKLPLWTVEEYLQLPEDGNRHEILEGEHYVTPAPTWWHQEATYGLACILRPFVHRQGLGRVLGAPIDVFLSPTDVLQPDLLFVSNERLDRIETNGLHGAPDLVVEVLSESTRRRDLNLKRYLYDRFGAREYWVLDTDLKSVLIFRGEGLPKVGEVSAEAGDVLTSALLPGLEIRVAEIFE